MDKNTKRMKELIQKLKEASRAYYQEASEIISNYEYDKLYDELSELERKSGVVLSGSPTQRVGYEIVSELPKETHEKPMLSLDKTKSVDELVSWLGDQEALLSWKLDGLTVVLTYNNGELIKAVTRGNGIVGEVITANARTFANIPLKIAYKGELILRGEAVISYKEFERINASISEVDAKYKNPRNLCSGSVRQLNSEITAKRHVLFYAFSLVKADGVDFNNSRNSQFNWLTSQGFDVVEHVMVNAPSLYQRVEEFAGKIESLEIPSDGLVLLLDDIAYGESLGTTARFPRNSIAFKWSDELRETTLKYIEWSPSRTGLINPVAVFEPVELEGTTVSRASVHNVSILEGLELGIGDTITVYKANMIIPQIADNLTRSGCVEIPSTCPVCGGKTKIKKEADVKTLYCTNLDCQVKHAKSFELAASRDALNIDGLSIQTIEKFIAKGFIKDYADLFRLERYKSEIVEMEGFGKKSYDNLIKSAKAARNSDMTRLVYALGIAGVGLAGARMLTSHFKGDFDELRHASLDELTEIDGIGEVIGQAIVDYFNEPKNNMQVDDLLSQIKLEAYDGNVIESAGINGKSFVITGDVYKFKNRKELEGYIRDRGGKVSSSVSSKTDYLINNDTTSSSSKNKKAKELNIPIISEDEFLKL